MKGQTLRLHFRTRLAILLAVLVISVTGITAWASMVLVQRAFERQFTRQLDSLLFGAERRLDSLKNDVADQVERLSRNLLLSESPLLEKMLDARYQSTPEVVQAAGEMLNRSRLDLLEVLDAHGRILSSGHWKEQVGLEDKESARLPEGEPTWRMVAVARGEHLAVMVRRPIRVGRLESAIVGGVFLDEGALEKLAGGGETLVLETMDEDAPSSGDGEIRSILLRGADGKSIGRLRMSVSRQTLDALLVHMRWTFLVLGVLGTLLASLAGGWIARRATRPVDEAIRAVEAIAAGEADYSFPAAQGDELQALPEAFSRLHRSLEDQQRRRAAAEKVAAWREVARRVAHEVKNPLAPIRLTIENLLKARRQAPEIFEKEFEEGGRAILEEVGRLHRMVTEFSEFARLPEPRPSATDLDGLVDSVLTLYSSEPGLVVERKREGGILQVRVDSDMLARAVKNLVGNAVEAIGDEGGTLTVETGMDGEMAFISIKDTGPGFSGDTAERLFEPYFTTKPEGTGLGMAIAYRIVAEQGGFITAANRRDGGAEVLVKLALNQGAPS